MYLLKKSVFKKINKQQSWFGQNFADKDLKVISEKKSPPEADGGREEEN